MSEKICVICNIKGVKKIIKEQPEIYEESVGTQKIFNKKTRQFETITKTTMKLKILPDEPDTNEFIENNTYQYFQNGFLKERPIPYCINVLNNVKHIHYGHYSCIRDLIIHDYVNNTKHKCPICRCSLTKKILNMVLNSSTFIDKLGIATKKHELMNKFKVINESRSINYYYKNGSYLFNDEIFKKKYDDDTRKTFKSLEIELYNQAHILYTKNIKSIAASKHGFKKYIKMKNHFFKNISDNFKGKSLNIDDADYAALCVLNDETVIDPRLNDYLKKHTVDTLDKSRYYIMSYYTAYMSRHHFNSVENIMKYMKNISYTFENGVENLRVAIWLFVINKKYFMFNDFELAKYMYNNVISAPKNSIHGNGLPIPLYGINTEHAIWLYSCGFVFTRFAYSKEHGKKFNGYMISIPSLLFWEQREYDTSIKSISNNVVNGSGIDKSVADAIATISYEARNDYGGVKFEDGPYDSKDMTLLQWKINKSEELAVEKRSERLRQQRDFEEIQEIEGFCIAECFNEPTYIQINEIEYYYNRLVEAIYSDSEERDSLEKYVYYKYNALKSGLKLNITLIQINRHPWLKKLIDNGEQGTMFYYTVLIDLFMNVIITGGSKKVFDEKSQIIQTANFCNILTNKILGNICNDLSIGGLKYMLDNCVNFGNYVDFVNNKSYGVFKNSRWDMLKEHVDYVSIIYAKMLVYSMKMVQTVRVDINKYQHSLHNISQDKTIIFNVPHFVLYINRIITNGLDEDDSEIVICFVTLIQKILEFVYTNTSIKRVKLYVKNKKNVLGDYLKEINVEIFSDMIIKRNDIEMNTKLFMKDLLTTEIKKLQTAAT